MARWTKYLTNLLPRTGRMIKEDGEAVNEADVLANVIGGDNAFVVQPFTEANVKRGLQYYIRTAWASDPVSNGVIPGGASRKLHFVIGAKQILVKLRIFEYSGEELKIEIFSNPVGVTGGDNLPVINWNAVNPVASTVTVTENVSTTSDGTPFAGKPEYFFGAANANQRDTLSIPEGRERVIPPNSEFLVIITNTNGQDARAQYFLDWYEGPTDIS